MINRLCTVLTFHTWRPLLLYTRSTRTSTHTFLVTPESLYPRIMTKGWCGVELFWDPGKRSHVDGKGDLMIGTLSVNGAGGVFLWVCVCVSSNGKSADGLSTLLSLWRYSVAPSCMCWPLRWGEALRPEVLKVKKVHGTVQIAAGLVLWLFMWVFKYRMDFLFMLWPWL